jgi:hypothetical protein
MDTRKTIITVVSAVLALSTALHAAAEPSTTDAQTQAGELLTARSQFHAAQPLLRARADDVQSQARAIVLADRSPSPTRTAADNGMAPLPVLSNTQSTRRGAKKNTDAQSMAVMVLLGRGA